MLKQIIRDIRKGENITVLATVVLIVVALVAKSLGVASDSLIDSLTLAMLGLIAVSFLVIRYRIAELLAQQKGQYDFGDTIQLLDKYPALALNEYLEEADEIYMLGVILRSTTFSYYDEFLERVRRGLRLKVALVNPESSYVDIEHVANRFSREDAPDIFRSAYDNILAMYSRVRKEAIEPGNVQLRLLDFVPPFGAYIFPHEREGGVMFVQIYAHKAPEGAAPKFILTEARHSVWYRKFLDLFTKIWDSGIDYF